MQGLAKQLPLHCTASNISIFLNHEFQPLLPYCFNSVSIKETIHYKFSSDFRKIIGLLSNQIIWNLSICFLLLGFHLDLMLSLLYWSETWLPVPHGVAFLILFKQLKQIERVRIKMHSFVPNWIIVVKIYSSILHCCRVFGEWMTVFARVSLLSLFPRIMMRNTGLGWNQ